MMQNLHNSLTTLFENLITLLQHDVKTSSLSYNIMCKLHNSLTRCENFVTLLQNGCVKFISLLEHDVKTS